MKKSILLIIVAMITVLLIAMVPMGNSYSNISQPSPGYTGAPGEQSCANAGCHAGTTNNNDPLITLAMVGSPAGYTPGQVYNFTVNAGQSAVYGFELTALNASNNAAGTLALAGATSSISALQSAGGRQYINHKNANSNNAWSFKWTAPASGDVYFYLAVINGDGDSTNSGDQCRTKAYKLTTTAALTPFNSSVGITEVKDAEDAGIRVFPNPVKDQLNMSYVAPETETVKADIYDLNGKVVMPLMDEQGSGHTSKSFSLDGRLSNGIYIIRMTVGTNSYFKKIMVQQ